MSTAAAQPKVTQTLQFRGNVEIDARLRQLGAKFRKNDDIMGTGFPLYKTPSGVILRPNYAKNAIDVLSACSC